MDWKTGDGVFTGSTLDLAVDGGEVVEAPKHVSPCIEMTQKYCLKPSNYADALKSHASIMPISPF